MSATEIFTRFDPRTPPEQHRASLALRVEVFLRRWSLDHRLALGERPDRDPALALRARQLTDAKTRRSLARGLRRARRVAFEPRRWGTAAPVDRGAVAEAQPLLEEVALRLTAPMPVGVRGAALISDLLADGASPLYEQGWAREQPRGALANRLRSAGNALDLAF